ncbi:NfeD family protein [Chitinasiproducens palmae]|uniref:Membrane protein implicated in regulation of membrane protease activity n=1 Tax=Chitinasiproducens palmae TaxID=1770053 RepID=A0A1H2PLS0_9BURK|nr:NfeD family protein [Chitinasiproducens palmae]SDV47449.1 Membrane protein implicated in regulation of membrane protease activity [Chitinasiproducens palmae]
MPTVPHWIGWAVAAGVLIIAELLSGTFYLLMLALGAGAAMLAALSGAGPSAQVFAAALVTLAGVGLLTAWRRRRGRMPAQARASGAADTFDLDRGQPVQVAVWNGRAARARYRGTEWDVRLLSGEPRAGRYRIAGIDGLTLLVEPDYDPRAG